MSIDSDTKAQIAELRRKRSAAKGVAERAAASALDLRIKANRANFEYASLGREIEALGGAVKR